MADDDKLKQLKKELGLRTDTEEVRVGGTERPAPPEAAAPDEPVVVAASRAPWVVAMVVLAVLGLGAGYFAASVFAARRVENYRTADAQRILDYLRHHKVPDANKPTLELIDEHRRAVVAMAARLGEAKKQGNLREALPDVLAFIKRCRDYEARVDVGHALGDAFYAADVVPALVRFAAGVDRLYLGTKGLVRQAEILGYIVHRRKERAAKPEETMGRYLLTPPASVPPDKPPMPRATRLAAMRAPQKLPDGRWVVDVLEEGKKKGVQVELGRVAIIDLTPIYEAVEGPLIDFTLDRLATSVARLASVAAQADFSSLEHTLEKLAQRPHYFTP